MLSYSHCVCNEFAKRFCQKRNVRAYSYLNLDLQVFQHKAILLHVRTHTGRCLFFVFGVEKGIVLNKILAMLFHAYRRRDNLKHDKGDDDSCKRIILKLTLAYTP